MSIFQPVFTAIFLTLSFAAGYFYGHKTGHMEALNAIIAGLKEQNPEMSEEEIIESLEKEESTDG